MRQAQDVWDDADREALVNFIAGDPEAGEVIPETGGVRKVRWSRSGTGKRSGDCTAGAMTGGAGGLGVSWS